MVIDSSALVAILLAESGWRRLEEEVEVDDQRLISGASVLESGIVIERRYGETGGRELDLFLHRMGIETVGVSLEQIEWARYGARTYGRGVHPAKLNFGDCFSYALSKTSGEPLLFKGDDFSKTDVAAVLRA